MTTEKEETRRPKPVRSEMNMRGGSCLLKGIDRLNPTIKLPVIQIFRPEFIATHRRRSRQKNRIIKLKLVSRHDTHSFPCPFRLDRDGPYQFKHLKETIDLISCLLEFPQQDG